MLPSSVAALMRAVRTVAALKGVDASGFRLILNNGADGGQEVPHLHAHIVGGPDPVGPMLKRI